MVVLVKDCGGVSRNGSKGPVRSKLYGEANGNALCQEWREAETLR